MVKKIALFGATGETGKRFLDRALKAGYEVKALVRDPSKLKINDSKLLVYTGDVLNAQDVSELLENTDLVVSLFGQVKGSPKDLQTKGTKNIVSAMEKNKVQRIISLSGGGLPFPEKDEPKIADKLIKTIMKIVVPNVLKDAEGHLEVLKNSSVTWTVARAPRLTNGEPLGKYRVGWVGVNASTKISRDDFADFILTQVEDESFKYQMPFVSN